MGSFILSSDGSIVSASVSLTKHMSSNREY